MVPIFQPNYQISAAWNNAAGLATLEGVLPSGDTRRFAPFQVFGSFNSGEIKIRSDGTTYLAGFPALVWRFEWISFIQYGYLSTTYCGGSVSGKVTIKTTTTDSETFANYNAILRLPKRSELTWNSGGFNSVNLTFTRLVAL